MFEINKRTVFVSNDDYQIFIGRHMDIDLSVWGRDLQSRQLQIYNRKRFKKRQTDLFLPIKQFHSALKKVAELKKGIVGWKAYLEDHGTHSVLSSGRVEILSLTSLIRFQSIGDLILFKVRYGNPNTWEITNG